MGEASTEAAPYCKHSKSSRMSGDMYHRLYYNLIINL